MTNAKQQNLDQAIAKENAGNGVTARITATWNPERGEESQVTITGLKDLNEVAAKDFLQDVIGELQDQLDALGA